MPLSRVFGRDLCNLYFIIAPLNRMLKRGSHGVYFVASSQAVCLEGIFTPSCAPRKDAELLFDGCTVLPCVQRPLAVGHVPLLEGKLAAGKLGNY
jgi:hypothetical protein